MTEQASRTKRPRVLIAGIGGASLGTEVFKCLSLADRYTTFGCDISPLAFGHFQQGFEQTFTVDRSRYIESVLEVCRAADIQYIVPGGEEPMVLLAHAAQRVRDCDISLAANSSNVIARFSDKQETFAELGELGFRIPLTLSVEEPESLASMTFPCIVKPATGSGGSSFVFLAQDREETLMYVEYLRRNGRRAVVQEYIGVDEGEFTIGVLSLPNKEVVGSIALRRTFDSKLSVAQKGERGLISSGYSQGYIGDFPQLRATAERIARAIGSQGPINVQGRVKGGELVPFEINPRFSASTYLRALAGFNEVDMFLRYLDEGAVPEMVPPRTGYYLRSLTETAVPDSEVQS